MENNEISVKSEKINPAFHLFLYLAMFFSLGFVIFGSIGIFFSLIDKIFKEGLDGVYQEYLRSSIAALVIASPIYYSILHIINKKLGRGEISPDSGIRKAITYLATFVFFAMSIGSLVSLLFGYLNGDLAEVSFFKTFVFLLISALMMSFYLWEVRRTSFSGKIFNILFSISIAVAITAVIIGFSIVDNPKVTRDKKQDVKVAEAMENVKQRISNFYFNNERLMNNDEFGDIGIDKDIQDKITYKPIGADEYELCGKFNYSFEEGYLYDYLKDSWRFKKGDYCFKLKAKAEGEFKEMVK